MNKTQIQNWYIMFGGKQTYFLDKIFLGRPSVATDRFKASTKVKHQGDSNFTGVLVDSSKFIHQ